MSTEEIWGVGKSEDPLSYFFISKFEEMKLVDIFPNVMIRTWSNGWCGDMGLAKWLDRFFLVEYMCEDFGKYRTWSYSVGISYHKVVIL